jgi:RNA-directed DNA polymerase
LDKTKPYEIPKDIVLEAFQRIKENKGAAGIDDESIEAFESDLDNNLYKIWNRMSSGSYFPSLVKAIEIPKKNGGTRVLGVPTVFDRVAQMVAKIYFEPQLEPHFHPDSYGYRPSKSAFDALGATRKRCWKYNWVLEFDIKGLFDNIDHGLLMKAVCMHTDIPWVILFIQRWLKARFQMPDGTVQERIKGTPQRSVVSPLLANLFLHYVFDMWMASHHWNNPFARYADDAVIHCRSKEEAERLWIELEKRLTEFGLELHPGKTRIVYCKDDDRQGEYPETKFDFLGYTFRPRRSKNKYGKHFINFTPAVSNTAKKSMQQEIHDWRMHLKPDKTLEDLSHMFNPILRGWVNYYGLFYKSELYCVLKHMNRALTRWALRKYKKLAGHKRRARHWLGKIARRDSKLFVHWQMGIFPEAG